MQNSKLHPYLTEYMVSVERGDVLACKKIHLLMKLVRKSFENDNIYIDIGLLENYAKLEKYLPFKLFPWEKFLNTLFLCTFWHETNMPRWKEEFLVAGRGTGKDAHIAYNSFCLTSPYNIIPNYNVDICANEESQAKRPVADLTNFIGGHTKLRQHYHTTKELVRGRRNGGIVTGHTSNAKTKDGLRPGMIVFNELHGYENSQNIEVYTTALGKVPHSRELAASTQGGVRDGPLDDKIELGNRILQGELPDRGTLPVIYELDSIDEIHNPNNWIKANPSLPYLPTLKAQMLSEYEKYKQNPSKNNSFVLKRMNLVTGNSELQVTSWENILATKRPLVDLEGHPCVAGIDYMQRTDMLAVRLIFRINEMRYSIGHAWLNENSNDINRIRIDWRYLAAENHITLVNSVEIDGDLVVEWLYEMGARYDIRKLALDNFRFSSVKKSLEEAKFYARPKSEGGGNIKLVRLSDIAMVQPKIDSWFNNQQIIFGDDPYMRWCISNTKLSQPSRISRERGNFEYAKVEAKSRKNDGFMAFVHAATVEEELESAVSYNYGVGVITF